MGKSLAEKLKIMDKISEGINNAAGRVIAGRISANQEMADKLKTTFIETPSINVNEVIGGGWPRGNISIVSGAEDSGKTFLLLETIAKNQKEDPNFIAVWLESEASLKQETLDMLKIDMDRFYPLYHEREGAGEMAIDRIEAMIASGAVDFVVINSLKCLVPSEEFKKSMGSLQVGAAARLNSKMTRKLTAIVEENDVALVIVQHLTTNIGQMYGDTQVLSGGNAIRYASMLTLDIRKKSIQESDPIKKEEGIKVGVTVKKNHVVGTRYPYLKTEYYGIYGQGTEIYLEALDLAVKQGVLAKTGAFIKIPDENGNPQIIDGEKMQWQGSAKFRQYCMDNPKFFEDLKKKINGEVEQMTTEEVEIAKAEELRDKEIVAAEEDVIEKATKAKSKTKAKKE